MRVMSDVTETGTRLFSSGGYGGGEGFSAFFSLFSRSSRSSILQILQIFIECRFMVAVHISKHSLFRLKITVGCAVLCWCGVVWCVLCVCVCVEMVVRM